MDIFIAGGGGPWAVMAAVDVVGEGAGDERDTVLMRAFSLSSREVDSSGAALL
jgi:hypothetical protein